jgi:hypothetical protein
MAAEAPPGCTDACSGAEGVGDDVEGACIAIGHERLVELVGDAVSDGEEPRGEGDGRAVRAAQP